MDINNLSLSFEERIVFSLRSLYEKYGYSHYRMSKFEEYDLYAKNKDFLVSSSVITFNDMDGRLLALKPDVTLSIVKNLKEPENATRKLYYNENVYRVGKGNRSFKELMQTGLEAFGVIDTYTLCETVFLALESLALISDSYVLDLSSLDILSSITSSLSLSGDAAVEFMRLIGEKNAHELSLLLKNSGVDDDKAARVCELLTLSGDAGTVLPQIERLTAGLCDTAAFNRFKDIVLGLGEAVRSHVRIDFSVVDNTKYYNGLVFKGFIEGVPTAVLSGGQYSRLMKRLGRDCDAVGFAVYHDTLERLCEIQNEFDVDTLLVYGEKSAAVVSKKIAELQEEGVSVLAQKTPCGDIKYRRIITL